MAKRLLCTRPLPPVLTKRTPTKPMPMKRISANTNMQNADVLWLELQGIADRVRILKRIIVRLSDNIHELQSRARANRPRFMLKS